MTFATTGWAVGIATCIHDDGSEEYRLNLTVFGNAEASIVIPTSEAKALIRHLVLLIDDAEKANEEKNDRHQSNS